MSTQSHSLLDDSGIPSLKDAVVVLVYTEWNHTIVDTLLEGCERVLQAHDVQEIIKIKVPGAVEIPFACQRYFQSAAQRGTPPDAFITLGCVLRGDTPHFEYVCQSVVGGVNQLNLSLPIPVIFGVLTVDTPQQAEERVGGKHGHKGEEAALTALKMIALNRRLS
jgi:6,7-dimethyl-8-ribityllumazine synthase